MRNDDARYIRAARKSADSPDFHGTCVARLQPTGRYRDIK
jgi:hypothetical protein